MTVSYRKNTLHADHCCEGAVCEEAGVERSGTKEPDHRHPWLLRPCSERPYSRTVEAVGWLPGGVK